MGSGSFGNGTGAFGGGGSGVAGPGSGGTTHERILALTKLTASVNANPEIAKVRRMIYDLLQNRTRANFLKATLGDDMVVALYRRLLSLQKRLKAGAAIPEAVSKEGAPENATLHSFAERICDRELANDTDERCESIARRAVSHVLLRTVGDDADLYYNTPIASLREDFNADSLESIADTYLANLIRETVNRDLLGLAPEGKAAIADASREIALSWMDKFKDNYGTKKNISFEDMLGTIASDYHRFSGGRNG